MKISDSLSTSFAFIPCEPAKQKQKLFQALEALAKMTSSSYRAMG